jgi:hypothetical protein
MAVHGRSRNDDELWGLGIGVWGRVHRRNGGRTRRRFEWTGSRCEQQQRRTGGRRQWERIGRKRIGRKRERVGRKRLRRKFDE